MIAAVGSYAGTHYQGPRGHVFVDYRGARYVDGVGGPCGIVPVLYGYGGDGYDDTYQAQYAALAEPEDEQAHEIVGGSFATFCDDLEEVNLCVGEEPTGNEQ